MKRSTPTVFFAHMKINPFDEIIGFEFGNRQTDRQTDKFFDSIYRGMRIFSLG